MKPINKMLKTITKKNFIHPNQFKKLAETSVPFSIENEIQAHRTKAWHFVLLLEDVSCKDEKFLMEIHEIRDFCKISIFINFKLLKDFS